MSINTTTLSAISREISVLTQEKQALDTEQQVKQSENILLVFKMYGELCCSVNEREMEIKLLQSTSSTLKAEIIQLEHQYAEEMDLSVNVETITKMVITAIQSVELNFQSCRNEYREHYHSDRVSEFVLLREKVAKLAIIEIKDALKIDTTSKEAPLALSEKTITPIYSLNLSKIDPLLKNEIERVSEKYDLLEKLISPLQFQNQQLICQKEKIVAIHKENLKLKNQNSPITKILTEVKATHNKIAWEQLAKVNRGIFPSNQFSPHGVNHLCGWIQKDLDNYINAGKNQMESLIMTLETYENLNKG